MGQKKKRITYKKRKVRGQMTLCRQFRQNLANKTDDCDSSSSEDDSIEFESRSAPLSGKENLVPLGDKHSYVSGGAMLNTFRAVHSCSQEDDKCLNIMEDISEKQGHTRSLYVLCTKCDMNVRLDENPFRHGTSFREHAADNTRLAFASDCVGLDYTSLKILCAAMNIPGPPDSYDSTHQEKIHKTLTKGVTKLLTENRKESFDRHRKEDGVARISVKCDGTYQKRGDRRRGYTSKVGIIIVFDAITDKVIDYEVLNKHCHTCTAKRKQFADNEDKFADWYVDHHMDECSVNFEGGSCNMEREAMKKMYKRSHDYGLEYEYLIGDGDSKAFLDVWDVYGVCDHCERVRHLLTKRVGDDFAEWLKTDDYREWSKDHETSSSKCRAVKKIDCIQHIGKCFRDKLESLAKGETTEKASDGKSLNRGNHRLRPEARIKLQKYFSSAVRSAIQPGVLSESELAKACETMRDAIMASLYHCLLLPDDEVRHRLCPENSWCAYRRGGIVEKKPHHLDPCFKELLLPIYEYYTQPSILRRMVPGMNTNLLECYNSILWSILPKTKYHGSRRTEIAVIIAIFYQQKGKMSIASLMQDLDLHIADTTCFTQLDRNRQKLTAARKDTLQKRYEKRLEAAKEQFTNVSEKSYHPGVCDAGAGPSSHMLSTPFVHSSPAKDVLPALNEFVVLPYGPMWYVGRVDEVVVESREVGVEFLYQNLDGSFAFASTPKVFFEPLSLVLTTLPQPTTNIISGSRCTLTFDEDALSTVSEKFNDWRRRKQHSK